MSHFNHEANNWDSPEKIKLINKLAAKTKEKLGLSEKIDILDIGCGTGLFGLEFDEYINSLVGIDNSDGMLEVFNNKAKNEENISALNINLDDEVIPIDQKFDLIVSAMAFHHIDQPEKLLSKLRPLLKSGGRIAIVDLEKEDGSFHPDPKNMGVKHFGFSNEEINAWADLNHLKVCVETINCLEKNEKIYNQFLAIFNQ